MTPNLSRAWLARVALMLTGILIISGCASATAESEFYEDGTATYSIEVTVDTGQIGALASIAGFDLDQQLPFGLDAEQQLNALGYTFETIREDDLVGFRATKEDAEAVNVADDLNLMFSAGTESFTGIEPFSGTFIQDGDTYTLDLTVDGEQLNFASLGDSIEIPDFGLGGLGGLSLDDPLEITYTAKMPGEINEDETNGQILSGNRVRWEIPTSGTAQLTAVSSTGSGSDFPFLLVGGLAGFVVLGLAMLALLVVILLMRRSPAPQPAVATATPAVPPPPPAPPAVSAREQAANADTNRLPAIPASEPAADANQQSGVSEPPADVEAGDDTNPMDTGDADQEDVGSPGEATEPAGDDEERPPIG